MKINWEQIVTNTISALITGVFIGACLIVWNGATSVDKKVTDATKTLEETVNYTKKAVEVLQEEIITIKDQNALMVKYIEDLKKLQGGRDIKEADKTKEAKALPSLYSTTNSFYEYKYNTPKDYIQARLPPVPIFRGKD